MKYWVGPWQWKTIKEGSYWTSPEGSVASIDLRNLEQCSTRKHPQGYGLFATHDYTNLWSDYTLLGTANDPRDLSLRPNVRSKWCSRFNLKRNIASNLLSEIVYEHLTRFSDPTGDERCLPLQPSRRNCEFSVWFGGKRIVNRQFEKSSEEAVPLLDLLQKNYRAARKESLDGITHPIHYKKYLGELAQKYQIDYRYFIPVDLPDEGYLPPETTITESFNKIDSSTLGPDLSWTEYVGSWSVLSNQCRLARNSGDASARADSDLSSTDHYSQCLIQNIGTGTQNKQAGAAGRFASAAHTHYTARILQINNTCGITKMVAGTHTALGTPVSVTVSTGVVIKLTCNGSSITSTYSGTDRETLTDTAITTGTRCGVFGFSSSEGGDVDLDDFEAADIGVIGAVGHGLINSQKLFRRSLVG